MDRDISKRFVLKDFSSKLLVSLASLKQRPELFFHYLIFF
jgi:hypothetical protein